MFIRREASSSENVPYCHKTYISIYQDFHLKHLSFPPALHLQQLSLLLDYIIDSGDSNMY